MRVEKMTDAAKLAVMCGGAYVATVLVSWGIVSCMFLLKGWAS